MPGTNGSNNESPWQFPEKLIPVVFLKAAAGEPIPLYGESRNMRDRLTVEDQMDALLLAACRGRADSKSQHGLVSGWRVAIASSAVMSCITACMPARID